MGLFEKIEKILVSNNFSRMNLESISVFKSFSRSLNDEHNKLRESIIKKIINKDVPEEFFVVPEWQKVKEGLEEYLTKLIPRPYEEIVCQAKAGRKFNYDFNFAVKYEDMEVEDFHVEFKYNASSVDNVPQFVSPMKPSKYLTQSYENFYYEKYLPGLAELSGFELPAKEDYMKQIHSNKPKCMKKYQELYYQGCSKSSKFTGKTEDIQFYEMAKKCSKESIEKFIMETELDTNLLSEYLYDTQKGKKYMLYSDGTFHLQVVNIDDYRIESVVKNAEMSRYVCLTKTGKKMEILLRWKNGNGIAFPAFQIS
jgi:hypothetical protein